MTQGQRTCFGESSVSRFLNRFTGLVVFRGGFPTSWSSHRAWRSTRNNCHRGFLGTGEKVPSLIIFLSVPRTVLRCVLCQRSPEKVFGYRRPTKGFRSDGVQPYSRQIAPSAPQQTRINLPKLRPHRQKWTHMGGVQIVIGEMLVWPIFDRRQLVDAVG